MLIANPPNPRRVSGSGLHVTASHAIVVRCRFISSAGRAFPLPRDRRWRHYAAGYSDPGRTPATTPPTTAQLLESLDRRAAVAQIRRQPRHLATDLRRRRRLPCRPALAVGAGRAQAGRHAPPPPVHPLGIRRRRSLAGTATRTRVQHRRVELTHQSIRLADLPTARGRTVIVLGNESNGIPEEAMRHVDVAVEIPMIGSGHSLNVAVAGSLVLYKVAGLI